MNLGLIDGMFLAQAIKAHMDTQNEKFLITYSRERRARAKEVIAEAEQISVTNVRLLTWRATFLQWAAWILGFFPPVMRSFVASLSGVRARRSSFYHS